MESTNSEGRSPSGEAVFRMSDLTKSQFLIWMGQKMNPESPLYNMVLTFEFSADVDREIFRESFQWLLDHSDSLRTVIEESDGTPFQRVRDTFPFLMDFLDFSQEPDARATLKRWIEKRCVRPFGLGERLFDSALLRISDDGYVWYMAQHHLITDGWSVTVLYRRMIEHYWGRIHGHLSDGIEPPRYREYIEFERTGRSSTQFAKAETYWRHRISDCPEPVSFYGRMASKETARSKRVTCGLDSLQMEKLTALSEEKGIRALSTDLTFLQIFVTLLFAFLHRMDGSTHLVIGTPFHNRTSSTFKETTGLFMEILPLQVEINGKETFVSLIEKVRREVLSSLTHAKPGVSSQESARTYNVLLNYSNITFTESEDIPMHSSWVHSGYTDPSHTLRLHVQDLGRTGCFTLLFDFNLGVFGESEQKLAVAHFMRVFEAFLEDRSQTIRDVSLLSREETGVLQGTVTQCRSLPPKQSLGQLFRIQAEATPDNIALVFEESRLSYRELGSRVERLVGCLRSLGVGPGTIVGVCFERSLEIVISILGILRAGGAYLPLEPGFPTERSEFILTDAGISILLTESKLLNSFEGVGVQLICVDAKSGEDPGEPGDAPVIPTDVRDPAYVLYTSGSTGKPKGVCCSSRGVINLLDDLEGRRPLNPGDACSWWTSVGFDVSIYEIFSALLYGRTLHITPERVRSDPVAFVEWLERQCIHSAYIPPFILVEMANGILETMIPLSLRRVLVGVEPIPERVLKAICHRLPALTIVNGYGPTEATICSTLLTFNPEEAGEGITPIGWPVQNTSIYLLDACGQPVSSGVPGELCIAGAGLAREYLNRPDLTQERFVSDPFSQGSRMRLYKTGDMARLRKDGSIEFIGRVDDQVKIRGHRVELGEVSSALLEHPELREAVVLAPEDKTRGKSLVAYVVPNRQPSPEPGRLQEYVRRKLPQYMVPAAVVVLESMPLTTTGKIDRQALPSPDRLETESEGSWSPPRTSQERTLARIWESVLGLERVGIHDRFVNLGGDSILNIQVIAKARREGIRLTSKQLFENPTVAELASIADDTAIFSAEQGLVKGRLELTPIQHWFFNSNFLRSSHRSLFLMLEVLDKLDAAILSRTFEELLRHHDALRLRFAEGEDGWVQWLTDEVVAESIIRVDISNLSTEEENSVVHETVKELSSAMDTGRGLLIRLALFERGAGGFGDRLLILAHHLSVDGVSWRILLEDLATSCERLRKGVPNQLPPKTTSLKEWSHTLAEYARSSRVRRELEFWKGLGQFEISPLPRDRPHRKDNIEESARDLSVELDALETDALLHRVHETYNTQINDVLLTAFAQSIAESSCTDMIRLDLEWHGRREVVEGLDLSRTVGWFTSIFPVVLKLAPCSDPGEALKSVKEQLRAVPEQGFGYGLLRYLGESHQIRKTLEAQPRSELLFNYLGQFDGTLSETSLFRMEGPLEVSHYPADQRSYLLEVNATVIQGKLRSVWTYSENLHERSTIEKLAHSYQSALRSLIGHCLSSGPGELTPSDFPLAGLDEEELGKLAEEINRIDRS